MTDHPSFLLTATEAAGYPPSVRHTALRKQERPPASLSLDELWEGALDERPQIGSRTCSMTDHDGVTSDGRSSHSDRHSVLPPTATPGDVAKPARQKGTSSGRVFICVDDRLPSLMLLLMVLDGRITVARLARPPRTCEAHIQWVWAGSQGGEPRLEQTRWSK